MNRLLSSCYLILCLFLFSCGTNKRVAFRPDREYAPSVLREDYQVFRNVLEAWHPSLYWYTPRDSMNYFFARGYSDLNDSMTEPQFRMVLSYVIEKIKCGHTSVSASRNYARYLDTAKLTQFPLILKFWKDTMAVAFNLDRQDTVLKRGTLIYTINGRTASQLTDTLFPYIVSDGYNLTGKYQYLSTGLHFSSWYKDMFGYGNGFDIGYRDTAGETAQIHIPVYDPNADTVRRSLGHVLMPGTGQRRPGPSQPVRHRGRRARKRRELLFTRNLRLDSNSHSAFLTLNTFERGYGLRGFFRETFKVLKDSQVNNLVIDVRSNGGGDAAISTLLTRYLIDKKFKLADSLYTVRRHSRYDGYIQHGFVYDVLTFFASRRHSDGYYHYGYFERHHYHPVRKDHFDGAVYILTGGNSFSATCLFAGALKGQSNVTLVGEETGGGYYGNTAWMIPDVTLPVTGIRFRLPRFRLVVDSTREKNGRGVMPDVPALPSVEALSKGLDFKTAKAKELILLKSADKATQP